VQFVKGKNWKIFRFMIFTKCVGREEEVMSRSLQGVPTRDKPLYYIARLVIKIINCLVIIIIIMYYYEIASRDA
jgi:hypothetical protein